jgi:uncharacterized protein YbjT (DUF2867 family)
MINMDIVIAGGHGNIAMLMHPLLKEKGYNVRGLIRNEDQSYDLEQAGAEAVIADLEKDDIKDAVGEADAAVFAAGAGPGSGAERKWKVDRDGAIKFMNAAKRNGIKRFVMISAMGLDKPRGTEVFRAYQRAKAEADEALRKSGLTYIIVKPGRLTDDKGRGLVEVHENLSGGEIPREDVAKVLVEVLETPELANIEFDLVTGDTPIEKAVKELV